MQWHSQGVAECGSCHTNLHKIIVLSKAVYKIFSVTPHYSIHFSHTTVYGVSTPLA